jgi:uncharacterized protein YeaO (DUF488 family)
LPKIKLKRIYSRLEVTDGLRVLVDRLWPRGVRHATSNVDVWLKNIGPSDQLRKFYNMNPTKWMAFKSKYKKELAANHLVDKLANTASHEIAITLVYASKNDDRNGAVVLKEVLERKLKTSHVHENKEAILVHN